MKQYKYLIIGGGMTADAAVQGIRQIDQNGTIGIISNESYPPYDRPPLTKGLWKGTSVDKIWRKASSEGVELTLSTVVSKIDIPNKGVTDAGGQTYQYEKLLLATGGKVRRLPLEIEGVIYYRTLDDFYRLRLLAELGQSFAVIGGGFIGSEIAAALALNKKSVTMVFLDDNIGARIYPQSLSIFLNQYYQSKGVDVLPGESVSQVERQNSRFLITTSKSKKLTVDGIIAGVGIQPNTELAIAAGLTVDNGIQVNQHLQTSHPDVFAAGDVVNFFNPALGKRIRVEHEDNANTSGKTAGANMAGAGISYDHLPFFYSDLFDLGYEAVGELDSRLQLVADWKEEFRKGVIYYLDKQRVRGVLLWNVWGQVEAARKLIADEGPYTADKVRGSIGK